MRTLMTYLIVFFLFFVCVIYPDNNELRDLYNLAVIDAFNQKELGVIHWPSLLFIFGSALVIWIRHAWGYRTLLQKNLGKDTPFKNSAESDFPLINEKISGYLDHEKQDKEFFKAVDALRDNPFFNRLMKILENNAIEEDVALWIQKYAERTAHLLRFGFKEYTNMATIMPLLGMMGTIAGLMLMFSNPSQLDDFTQKFSGLATALLTTLYATLITVVLLKPRQRHIEKRISNLEHEASILMHNALLFYHHFDMPTYMEYRTATGGGGAAPRGGASA